LWLTPLSRAADSGIFGKKNYTTDFFVGCMPKLREEDCGELDASREAVSVDADEDE
jgi:hypothetical protein